MTPRLVFCLFLAALWGLVWALFLQRTELGRFLAARRTYITVVVGVGVDLGIAAIVTPWAAWWPVVAIVALSAVGIVTRSIWNEWTESRELTALLGLGNSTNGDQDPAAQQDVMGARRHSG